MKQLSSLDATFLYLDSRGAHLTLTGVYVYRQPRRPHQPLTYADIVRHIRSRLHAAPGFTQKLVRPPLDLDYPYWIEDADFEIESHIRRYEGAVPRNRSELYDIVAELHAHPLDMSRPLWETQVLETLGPLEGLPKNCFALITRYHHSAIDGAAGNFLIESLHDVRPRDIEDCPAHPAKRKIARKPGTVGLLFRAAVNNLVGQVQLAQSVGKALPGIVRSGWAGDEDAGRAPVPKTRFNRSIGPRRVFHATSIPLAEIKQVRNAVKGATVNDVILAACAGGLRSWLEERDELPENSLVVMVPVNLRAGHETSAGNRVAPLFIPIYTDIADPLARLRAVHRRASRAKAQVDDETQERIRDITHHIPALALSSSGKVLTGLGLGRRLNPVFNCTITNVPSPNRTLYLGRARMVYTTGAGPVLDGVGLIISLFTYAGQVDFTFTSCPEMLPEPAGMGQHLLRAFGALKSAALSSADG